MTKSLFQFNLWVPGCLIFSFCCFNPIKRRKMMSLSSMWAPDRLRDRGGISAKNAYLSEIMLTRCHMATYILLNIVSGNGLLKVKWSHCFESTSRLRALLCRLWQVPSLVIGPFYCPYPSGYPSQLPGEYTAAHTQLGATAYKSALTGTHFLLGREKQCSVKWLAQGHNEQSHRQGIEPGTWPRS